jgi:hypothetical protein
MTVALFTVAAVVIVAVPLTLALALPQTGQTLTFVIPAGTADRVAAGEEVTILPNDLRMRQRDLLVLINEDSSTHQVASILIGSGERVETRFSKATSVSGYCSLHPSGQITISVDGKISPTPASGTR